MLFNRTPPRMVTAQEALPGRATPLTAPHEHAVLGTPLTGPWPEGHEVALFAMGCFWGAERIFWKLEGVWTTAAVYVGGFTPNPTYEETCTGRTGHAEGVMVVFDPTVIGYERLLQAFWENHDPTQLDRQGNDVGTQYRSAILATTPEQLETALATRDRYQAALETAGFGAIATEVTPLDQTGAGSWYLAEDSHQQYLHKHPNGYCNHGFCQVGYDLAAHGQGQAKATLPD